MAGHSPANEIVARTGALVVALMAAATAAQAQSIICCSQPIGVGGNWVGSGRVADCQQYFNEASTTVLRRMCQQREALSCINTERCRELPPEDQAAQDGQGAPSVGAGAALPPNPDRAGLEDGFDGPPAPGTPAPAPLPRRLVYLIKGVPGGGAPSTSFMLWLDRAACPLPLDVNNRLTDSAAARHVVRGKVIHRQGRVRVEAEAQQRPGGAKLGPFAAETDGEDAVAVAKATRDIAEKLKLVCRR